MANDATTQCVFPVSRRSPFLLPVSGEELEAALMFNG